MKGFQKDIVRKSVNMAWPAIIESFFGAFAGLIDSLMVSALGSSYVAAVGLTTQPKFLGFAFFLAMNVAISALVARRRGQRMKDDANRILCTALVFILIMGILFSIGFVSAADWIIHACGSTPETHDDAVLYYRIIMGGMIFNCIQMGVNAAQRGAGNTKITMRTNVTSNTINMIANYLLIEGHFGFPALGIRGAAIATVFGTVVAAVMSILSLMNPDGFVSIPYIIKNRILPAFEALKNLIKVAYSVFFEQLLMRIGFMATSLMAAKMGTGAMAAHQVGMNILGLTFAFGDGVQAAAVALIGRSLGEKNEELAKEYGRTCRMIGFVISIALALVYLLGGRGMMQLFFEEEYIVNYGVGIMYVAMVIVLFQIQQVVYMGCLRGAGDTLYTAIASAVSVTVVRTVSSYTFGYLIGWGIVGIWLGILADQISRYLFGSIRFRQGKWTKIKI